MNGVLNPTLTELINAVASLEREVEHRDGRIEELERKLAALEVTRNVEEEEKKCAGRD